MADLRQYPSGLEEPLRVSNIDSHLRALNMPDFLPSVPATSLLVAPVRHQRAGVGTIYLAHDTDDREFTREDEETLVLLDLALSDGDGIELMQAILKIAHVPVSFLSAFGRDETIARAFEMGAVDYLVKPFSPTELAARMGSALRRREVSETEPYVLGDLTINYPARRVTVAGRPVQLTAMEYRMLAELSAAGGRPLTYQRLQERVWGELDQEDLRPVRTMVGKLRRKLGDDSEYPKYIFTEARVGYRMPRGEE